MTRSHFTEEQILAIVQEGEAGEKSPICVACTASATASAATV